MKINIDKYPSYKDSGVEWIEDVPSYWEVKKFKRIFHEIKKRSNPELNCGSISFGKVVYKDDEKIPESTKRSYQVVQKGDFLVNPLNLNYDLISLRIALSDVDVVVSSGYIVLSNSIKLDKIFYKYFLHRFDVAFMKLLGSGVRQTLNWNDIANCDLIFPPLPEQISISAFLDEKTTLIDKAIDIKQKQIALLKERRQIIIQQAVTRGLNPNVKMKNWGVEWFGEIPKGWEVKKLGHVSKIGNGSTPSRSNNSYWDFGTYPWLNSSKVNDEIITTADQFITVKALKECHLPKLSPGTLVIAITGEGKTRGMVALCNIEATINQHLAYIKTDEFKISPAFLLQFLQAMYTNIRTDSTGLGSTKGAITCESIKSYLIPIPPNFEQHKIVNYINNFKIKISTAISLKEKEIEKLKEYKATLINSAVTGKIKIMDN